MKTALFSIKKDPTEVRSYYKRIRLLKGSLCILLTRAQIFSFFARYQYVLIFNTNIETIEVPFFHYG